MISIELFMWAIGIMFTFLGIVWGVIFGLMKWNDIQRQKIKDEFNEKFNGIKHHIKEDYMLKALYENDQKHNMRRIEVMEQTLIEIKASISFLPKIQSDLHRLCIKEGLDAPNGK